MLSVLVMERRMRGMAERGLVAGLGSTRWVFSLPACLVSWCSGVLVWTLAIGKVDAGDLDDGLPRRFLVGAIVKVWVVHRLDRASELHGRRSEELP